MKPWFIGAIDTRWAQRYLTQVTKKAERYNGLAKKRSWYARLENSTLDILLQLAKWLDRRGIITGSIADELQSIIKSLKD